MAAQVYLETSIVSYLAARPSRDLVVAARQQLTHEWWHRRRGEFEIYVSELVLAEAAAGNEEAAERRLQIVSDLPLLTLSDEANELARRLVEAAGLPSKAQADALHIAVAACHGMEYLLTWNSRTHRQRRVAAASRVGVPATRIRAAGSLHPGRTHGSLIMPQTDTVDQPWSDPIVEEVRRAREALLRDCEFDLEELAVRLRASQRAGGRETVSRPPRAPSKDAA